MTDEGFFKSYMWGNTAIDDLKIFRREDGCFLKKPSWIICLEGYAAI